MNDNHATPLTVQELADYLKLNRMTIYKMLKNKEIPGIRLGKQWRFFRDDIDTWLKAKIIVGEKQP